jgi:hypothetical protein
VASTVQIKTLSTQAANPNPILSASLRENQEYYRTTLVTSRYKFIFQDYRKYSKVPLSPSGEDFYLWRHELEGATEHTTYITVCTGM